jgi:predicted kinase
LCSDVERKRLFGLEALTSRARGVDLYTAEATRRLTGARFARAHSGPGRISVVLTPPLRREERQHALSLARMLDAVFHRRLQAPLPALWGAAACTPG